jgi:hypothetical protein
MFGAGLPTPTECLTEGLPRSQSTLASQAFWLSEHRSKKADVGPALVRGRETRAQPNALLCDGVG